MLLGCFLIDQIFFYSGGLGANRKCVVKTRYEISYCSRVFCGRALFCYTVLCVLSSFAIISMKKRELSVFLSSMWLLVFCFSSSRYRWFDLQCVIVAFPGQSSSLAFFGPYLDLN